MAYSSRLLARTFAQKREPSVMVARLVEGSTTQTILGTTGTYKIANLPKDSIITNAYVYVKAVSDAATSCTLKLGTSDGGAEIMAAANVKAATGAVGSLVGKIETGTGVAVYATLTTVGATTQVGEYVAVIEYLEYTKTNGEYTSTVD